MRGGPVASYTWRCTLERTRAADGSGALEGGTRATVRMEIVAAAPSAHAQSPGSTRSIFTAKFAGLGALIDAYVVDGAASPYVRPASPADAAAVETAVARLKGDACRRSPRRPDGNLVRAGADADVVRMRPFSLADDWKLTIGARFCARSSRACPRGWSSFAGGSSARAASRRRSRRARLEEIKPEGHCQLCDITFDLDLDRAVEATFLPHPAVRRVPDAMFCIGGPGRTPHVLVQGTVEAGATRELDVPQSRRAATASSRAAGRRRPSRWTTPGRPAVVGQRRREGSASGAASRCAGRRDPADEPMRGRAPRQGRAARLRQHRRDGARRCRRWPSSGRSSRASC